MLSNHSEEVISFLTVPILNTGKDPELHRKEANTILPGLCLRFGASKKKRCLNLTAITSDGKLLLAKERKENVRGSLTIIK